MLIDIRAKFFQFFQNRQHNLLKSGDLIPNNDDSILFINAGMAPLKEYFLGFATPPSKNLVTIQKCIRAGGKHNDLDEVGFTRRHHTFFEMCGNFSFGGYGVHEAINLAWDFLTKDLNLNPMRLYVTVHPEDEASLQVWNALVSSDRITKLPANEWSMGTDGPCGMCTEIFFDNGDHLTGDFEEGDRFVEIWNIVIMTHQVKNGIKSKLDKICIDTGAGLERLNAVVAGVDDNYAAPFFAKIIKIIEERTGLPISPSHKIIADHARAIAFVLSEKLLPSNTSRGYVLRRIMRRAMLHQDKLKDKSLIRIAVEYTIENMSDAYPELLENKAFILHAIEEEQKQFHETCLRGLQYLDKMVQGKSVPAEMMFKLYDTYGLPVELAQDIFNIRGLSYDNDGFERLMDQARDASRDQRKNATSACVSEFLGYDSHQTQAKVLEVHENYIILDRTPFYPESGGQQGDKGTLTGDGWSMEVEDTQKINNAIGHYGKTVGTPKVGNTCTAQINVDRRTRLMQHHSATHLMFYVLNQMYGEVEQAGSLVRENMLRLDVKISSPIDTNAVEMRMNELIQLNEPTEITFMTKEESKALGVKAGPDEKYGAEVRVVKVGPEVELCCGTHVQRTGDIGYFCILKESAIRAGTRRIEAVVGMEAVKYTIGCNNILKNLARTLNVGIDKIEDALAQKLQQKKVATQAAQVEQHQINDSTLLMYSKNGDLNQLIKKANEFQKYDTTCMFNVTESKTEFAILSKIGSAKRWFEAFKVSLSASGGGKDSLIRGGIQKEISLSEILGIFRNN